MPRGIEARFVLAVLAYGGVQVAMRLLVGPALELDEAEAFYHARRLAWGYGPQPPLYFWLQWGLFQILGEGLLALALLKALILGGTALLLFRLLRWEAGPAAAAVAAMSLSLLPQVLWEGQRALTHSVLALVMAVAAAGLLARALRTGRWRDHLLLGMGLGLGVLSKFNFVVWPLGLLLAAALLPEWRARLRPVRLAGAGGIAALVVVPVALWMARNQDLASDSLGKLRMETGGWAARLMGTGDLLMAWLSFLGFAAVVLGGFAMLRRGATGAPGAVPRLLAAGSGWSILLLWIGMLASGATEVAERWLLPMAWALVPAAVLGLWPGLRPGARRGLAWTVAGLWIAVVPLLPYASLVDPGYRGAEFGPLVERLRGRGAGAAPLLVEGQWVAGNIALVAPDLTPELWAPGRKAGPGTVLVVGEAERWADGLALTDPEVVVIRRGGNEIRILVGTTGPE